MANQIIDKSLKYLGDFAKSFKVINVKFENITGTAQWAGKYYKDFDVSSYVPNGSRIYAVTLGSATNGGVDTVVLNSDTVVRLLKSADFTGSTQYVSLFVGLQTNLEGGET